MPPRNFRIGVGERIDFVHFDLSRVWLWVNDLRGGENASWVSRKHSKRVFQHHSKNRAGHRNEIVTERNLFGLHTAPFAAL
ncbi:hypothetical protein X769_28365 [Mesorhizobium sp. LSJC268A00]|nr:hypothetical protein X769_28365 [Mesorhizobium sp. LSJC268A00]